MNEGNNLIPTNLENAVEITIDALISTIPVLGGPISTITSGIQGIRKDKRFVEFIEGIKNDLEGKIENIRNDFISKEDFIDIFEETTRRVVSSRQHEKREAFRHILTNSITTSQITYDEIEEYLKLVDRLRPEHIFMLKILKNPIAYDESIGNKVGKGGGAITSIHQIMRTLLPDWNESDIVEILSQLEDERLVHHMNKRFNTMLTDQGINHLVGSLTEKGNKFCNYIN